MTAASRLPTSATPPAGSSRRRAALVDRLTWRLAIANLVAQIGIIVTGGAVRLTGSGLGCSTWPQWITTSRALRSYSCAR